MTDFNQTVNLADHATAFVGGTQDFRTQVFYYGEDFVEMTEVPKTDLSACAEGRFVPPGGQWEGAQGKLGHFGSLLVTGERGIGRRTAALRLLSGIHADGPIYELAPTWSRPGTHLIPSPPSSRCILDMSEPTERLPSPDFGKRLLDWARAKNLRLVVITTDEAEADAWTASAGDAAIRLRSPQARELADRELSLTVARELRPMILDAPAFEGIWKSNPKAADTRRLVDLIAQEPFRAPEEIADEYQGWRKWIDNALSGSGKTLGSRTLLWAAAFCDGGQRGSVLRMSEELRRELKDDRGLADILCDDPASKRLKDAKLEPESDRAEFAGNLHGIASALRAYLWREFEDPSLRARLTKWLVAQFGVLPPDDAERLTRGVLDIAFRFRDDTLLREVRDNLSGDNGSIVVQLLSRAATDPQFGAHVRSRLYNWAKDSPSQADLVAEVCGAEFGEQQPNAALVRLGWVAQKSGPDSPALARALASISARRPTLVLESISKWLDDTDRASAGINAFLALASTSAGAALLCGRADPDSGQAGYRNRLINWFQRSATESDISYQATISVYQMWEKFSGDGTINARVAIPVLGRGIEPALGKNPMRQLRPGFPETDDFMGQVFTVAIRGEEGSPETDVIDAPPMLLTGQSARTEGPAQVDPSSALQSGITVPEPSAAGAPFPAPESPASPDLRLTAPDIIPPQPAIPGHGLDIDTPIASDLPADDGADRDVESH